MSLFSPFLQRNSHILLWIGLDASLHHATEESTDSCLGLSLLRHSREGRELSFCSLLYTMVSTHRGFVLSHRRHAREGRVQMESTPFRPWLSHVQLPRTMPNVMVSLRARFGLWYLCRIRLGPDHGVHKQVCVKIARGVDEVMRSSHDACQ